ncbi:MAG: DegV family protein [Anaerolineae bacterium]|nr:DegV family protein [Anaerolineae bacterium]
MSPIRIVTDSGADLAPETAEQLGITVVPLIIRFGTDIYMDGELSQDEFWEKAENGPHHPGTSQPSPGAFERAFERLIQAGHQVLCITLTSKHSGTFSSASTAARRFGEKVRVIDSLSLSLGQGFQVLAAARAAIKGIDRDAIVALVKSIQERARIFILLDTIEHLRYGGRADNVIPLLSRVTKFLNIKPLLEMVDGQLALQKLVRTYERGMSQIRNEVANLKPVESLAVLHTRCEQLAQEMANALAAKLEIEPKQVLVAETGPALASHGGPRLLGVIAVPASSSTYN